MVNRHKSFCIEKSSHYFFYQPTAAVIVSFLEQFGSFVFPDKVVVMSDLMSWLSTREEGEICYIINIQFNS